MNRLRALFAALILFFTVSSFLCMAETAGHDCHGADCPVCAVMLAVTQNIQLLRLSLQALCCAAVTSVCCHKSFLSFPHTDRFVNSLRKQKIRFND